MPWLLTQEALLRICTTGWVQSRWASRGGARGIPARHLQSVSVLNESLCCTAVVFEAQQGASPRFSQPRTIPGTLWLQKQLALSSAHNASLLAVTKSETDSTSLWVACLKSCAATALLPGSKRLRRASTALSKDSFSSGLSKLYSCRPGGSKIVLVGPSVQQYMAAY